MKRACIIILIVLLVILAALVCIRLFTRPQTNVNASVPAAASTKAPESTAAAIVTPEPTQVPTPSPEPEPESEPGVVRADGTGLIFALLARGYDVEITGESGDYYIVLIDGTEALVEKRFVRLDSEEEFQWWKGFAKANAPVYSSAYLSGEPIAKLKLNAKIVVLDKVGDALLISWDGQQGYTPATKVSKYRISTGNDSGGGDFGGGDGGGGGGGGAVDGGDIALSMMRPHAIVAVRLGIRRAQDPSPSPEAIPLVFPCSGMIIANDTEAYLSLLQRGDTVKVTDEDETYYHVYIDGVFCTVLKKLVRLSTEAAYTEWDGFTDNRAPFYADYRMNNELQKLARNTVVHVLEDLGDCYLVELDGQQGFILLKQVKEKRFSIPSASGGGGGDFGGGDGGGGGGGGGGAEWTEPVL